METTSDLSVYDGNTTLSLSTDHVEGNLRGARRHRQPGRRVWQLWFGHDVQFGLPLVACASQTVDGRLLD